jgi:hypothetical protein
VDTTDGRLADPVSKSEVSHLVEYIPSHGRDAGGGVSDGQPDLSKDVPAAPLALGSTYKRVLEDMMITAVIFDIDGTLVDSVDLHAEAWAVTFAKYGKQIAVHDVRRQIGKGSDQLLPVFFSQNELTEFGEAMEKDRSELFRRDYLPRVISFPQTRELFKRIRQGGT